MFSQDLQAWAVCGCMWLWLCMYLCINVVQKFLHCYSRKDQLCSWTYNDILLREGFFFVGVCVFWLCVCVYRCGERGWSDGFGDSPNGQTLWGKMTAHFPCWRLWGHNEDGFSLLTTSSLLTHSHLNNLICARVSCSLSIPLMDLPPNTKNLLCFRWYKQQGQAVRFVTINRMHLALTTGGGRYCRAFSIYPFFVMVCSSETLILKKNICVLLSGILCFLWEVYVSVPGLIDLKWKNFLFLVFIAWCPLFSILISH